MSEHNQVPSHDDEPAFPPPPPMSFATVVRPTGDAGDDADSDRRPAVHVQQHIPMTVRVGLMLAGYAGCLAGVIATLTWIVPLGMLIGGVWYTATSTGIEQLVGLGVAVVGAGLVVLRVRGAIRAVQALAVPGMRQAVAHLITQAAPTRVIVQRIGRHATVQIELYGGAWVEIRRVPNREYAVLMAQLEMLPSVAPRS